jgi:hypothetical protein
MALLDTASLIVTPNGYKASKLYSIVPSDGTGDMTFSRTGNTATRVNSSGIIETVNANIPRLDYLDGTCPKLLLEPQRTNLILQSQDISSASWSKPSSPVIVTNVAIAPDGTTTADSIQSTDTSGFKSIKQTNSVSANSTFTFSFFVKKETVRTNYGGVGISLSGGTVKYVFVVFDETNGTQINLTNSTITPILKTEIFGNYYRFIITATDNGSNTTLTSEIYSTLSTNGISYNTAIGSARTIWGMQFEAGSFATSYIPTTTASVTRNADSLGKSNVYTNGYISSYGGTWFIDLANNNGFTRDSAKIGMWIGESNSNSINAGFSSFNIRTLSGTAQKLQISFYNGTIGTTLYQTTQVDAKIAITFNGTTANIFVNGTKVVTSASAGITLANFQYFNFQEDVPYFIKSTALFASPLSDTNCISLTTL